MGNYQRRKKGSYLDGLRRESTLFEDFVEPCKTTKINGIHRNIVYLQEGLNFRYSKQQTHKITVATVTENISEFREHIKITKIVVGSIKISTTSNSEIFSLRSWPHKVCSAYWRYIKYKSKKFSLPNKEVEKCSGKRSNTLSGKIYFLLLHPEIHTTPPAVQPCERPHMALRGGGGE